MLISKIQRFSTHDGPGLRTTVFFKGCPLKCPWCHNPENKKFTNEIFYTQKSCIGCGICEKVCPNGCHSLENGLHLFDRTACTVCGLCAASCPSGALELCANDMTVTGVFEEIKKDVPFYGGNGGVTLSGGEPLAFKEAAELLDMCAAEGIDCCVETSGAGIPEVTEKAARVCRTLFFDFKDGNPERHLKNVGVPLENIVAALKKADRAATGDIIIRCIIIKGLNSDAGSYSAIAGVYNSLKHAKALELLPYHAYFGSKNVQLGGEDNGDASLIPDAGDMAFARQFFTERGVNVI